MWDWSDPLTIIVMAMDVAAVVVLIFAFWSIRQERRISGTDRFSARRRGVIPTRKPIRWGHLLRKRRQRCRRAEEFGEKAFKFTRSGEIVPSYIAARAAAKIAFLTFPDLGEGPGSDKVTA